MKSINETEQSENVVVVEQRDKGTLIYIAIAAVLGLAAGGLVGSTLTESNWEARYSQLQLEHQNALVHKEKIVVKVEETVARVDVEISKQVDAALAKNNEQHALEISAINNQISELEKVNMELEALVSDQKGQITASKKMTEKLNQQADMQALMFERSRELFQREYQVKQALSQLREERDSIKPTLNKLKKDCDVFLQGQSWDTKTDACDKQDEAQSRLSHINQMIEVHSLDLKQIEQLVQEMGI